MSEEQTSIVELPSAEEVATNPNALNENEILATVLDRLQTGEGVAREIRILARTVELDEEYAWTWYCNLKMAVIDADGSNEVGRKAAAIFMNSLFGVDITKHPLFIKEVQENMVITKVKKPEDAVQTELPQGLTPQTTQPSLCVALVETFSHLDSFDMVLNQPSETRPTHRIDLYIGDAGKQKSLVLFVDMEHEGVGLKDCGDDGFPQDNGPMQVDMYYGTHEAAIKGIQDLLKD